MKPCLDNSADTRYTQRIPVICPFDTMLPLNTLARVMLNLRCQSFDKILSKARSLLLIVSANIKRKTLHRYVTNSNP